MAAAPALEAAVYISSTKINTLQLIKPRLPARPELASYGQGFLLVVVFRVRGRSRFISN